MKSWTMALWRPTVALLCVLWPRSSDALAVQAGQDPVAFGSVPYHTEGTCLIISGTSRKDGEATLVYTGTSKMTAEVCTQFCLQSATLYFGMKGQECTCFDKYTPAVGTPSCTTTCPGDSAQTCGGAASWSVHLHFAWVSPVKAKSCGEPPVVQGAASTCDGASGGSLGCVVTCEKDKVIGVNTLFCDTTRGVWVGTAECVAMACSSPPTIPNAQSTCQHAAVDKPCEVVCKPGFVLEKNTLMCAAPAHGSVTGSFVGEAICKEEVSK